MQAYGAAVEAGSLPDRRPIAHGMLTLRHLDGRSVASKRAKVLAKSIQVELNAGRLTQAQRIAIEHAAALAVLSEDAMARALRGDPGVSVDDAVRAAGAARRARRDLASLVKPKADFAW